MALEPSDDTAPARDLDTITPSTEELNPRPRALWITTAGVLQVSTETGDLPQMSAAAGWLIPLRATRILPSTTATVVALY